MTIRSTTNVAHAEKKILTQQHIHKLVHSIIFTHRLNIIWWVNMQERWGIESNLNNYALHWFCSDLPLTIYSRTWWRRETTVKVCCLRSFPNTHLIKQRCLPLTYKQVSVNTSRRLNFYTRFLGAIWSDSWRRDSLNLIHFWTPV